MSNVIPLHAGRHQEVRHLLSWYANGSLDDAEAAQVEAHLAGCPQCRADLAAERRLKEEVADLPADAGGSWAVLRSRIMAADGRSGVASVAMDGATGAIRRPRKLGWIIAAQAAALVAATSVALHPQSVDTAPRYHALGSAPAPVAANVIVLFRPDASEAQMREALRAADARLVGGPTEANAYLLHVGAGRRPAAVAALQALPIVSLAQPIDQSPSS